MVYKGLKVQDDKNYEKSQKIKKNIFFKSVQGVENGFLLGVKKKAAGRGREGGARGIA